MHTSSSMTIRYKATQHLEASRLTVTTNFSLGRFLNTTHFPLALVDSSLGHPLVLSELLRGTVLKGQNIPLTQLDCN